MIRSHLCRQCRIRLSQKPVVPRHPQLQSIATFYSLRNSQSQPVSESQTSLERSHKERVTPYNEDGQQPLIRNVRTGEAERAGRYSRRDHNVDTQQNRHMGEHNEEARPHTFQEADLATLSPARSMQDALSRKDVVLAWQLFRKHYPSRHCIALENPSLEDRSLLIDDRIFIQLSNHVTTQFCNNAKLLITPTQLLFQYQQLGIENPALWSNSFGYLTDQLLWSIHQNRPESGKQRSAIALLNEVLSLWQLLFQCKGKASDALESISYEWPAIPDMPTLTRARTLLDLSFAQGLQTYHPKLKSSPALQFSAITIFNLFDDVNQDTFRVPESLKMRTAPFIRLVTASLRGTQTDYALKHIDNSLSFKALPQDFQTAVIDQVKSAPSQAVKITRLQSSMSDHGVQAQEVSHAEKVENLRRFHVSQIDDAVTNKSHVGRLEAIWEEVKVDFKDLGQATVIPSSVYNAFLSGFMEMRQPQQTVMVWNHMISNGVKPDMRTWVAMLDGCTAAQDLEGFNAIWERMLKTGANPDAYVWNSRIRGLIYFRQISMAFAAMDEMGNRWLAMENAIRNPPQRRKGAKASPPAPKANPFAKPSIEMITGAISAFVQGPRGNQAMRFEQKLQNIQRILKWAGQFDLKPTTYTYNSLIQLYLDEGDYPTTFKLLRQMEEEGLEGDLVTHTMLIRAAFNNQKFDDLSESEQTDRVFTLFSELEAGGLKLNARIYSIIVDRLLKVYSNLSATRAVINHMFSRKIDPEPAVYASLISHYFQQSPPDIAAVDSFMLRVFGPAPPRTDKYFFDRVIEGYAVHGEVNKMMDVLGRMSSHGKLPGYKALNVAVRALVDAGDVETARSIVRDVQRGEGLARGGVTGGQWQETMFLWTVRNIGINQGINLTETETGVDLPRPPKPLRLGDLDRAGKMVEVEVVADGDGVSGLAPHTSNVNDLEPDIERDMRPAVDKLYDKRQADTEMDDEYVHAEHAGYLSDELEPNGTQERSTKEEAR
jgi:pentatricopeptide repeat protein